VSEHATEALKFLEGAWQRGEQSDGTDPGIAIQTASAIVHSNLAVAEEIKKFRELMGQSAT
jgi:hypothetical protein